MNLTVNVRDKERRESCNADLFARGDYRSVRSQLVIVNGELQWSPEMQRIFATVDRIHRERFPNN